MTRSGIHGARPAEESIARPHSALVLRAVSLEFSRVEFSLAVGILWPLDEDWGAIDNQPATLERLRQQRGRESVTHVNLFHAQE